MTHNFKIETIYVVYDTLDDKYFTGQFPVWAEFEKSKIWHRLRDAKIMFSRAEKRFETLYDNVRYRYERYPTNIEIKNELDIASSRNNYKNQGLIILDLTVSLPIKNVCP